MHASRELKPNDMCESPVLGGLASLFLYTSCPLFFNLGCLGFHEGACFYKREFLQGLAQGFPTRASTWIMSNEDGVHITPEY